MKTGKKSSTQIDIKTPTKAHIVVKVRGISELIYEKFSSKSKQMMLDKMLGNKIERPPKNPEKEFYDSIYWYDEKKKTPGVKAVWFKKGIVDWGKQFKEGAKLNRVIQVGKTFDANELLPVKKIVATDPHMRRGEDGECGDMVRNQNGVADIRFRGALDPGWEVEVPITYHSSEISAEKIVSLLDTAGTTSGVGGWRPQHGGVCGMYEVIKK